MVINMNTVQTTMASTPATVVIDTNWVLDLLLFQGPDSRELHAALKTNSIKWLATTAMRDEWRSVLGYTWIQDALNKHGQSTESLLTEYDQHTTHCDDAPYHPPRCRDPDDQKFIDLAMQHRALLLSRDKHLLRLRKALKKHGIVVSAYFPIR